MDVSIELVKKIEGADDLSGAVEVMQPILQLRAVVRIAGKAVYHQLHLLLRQILERELAGGWLDQAFDGIVIIELYVHLACDRERLRRLLESKDSDGVAVDVAQPAHLRRRRDTEPRIRDMHVMSLARPQQRAMGTEFDQLIVVVLRF